MAGRWGFLTLLVALLVAAPAGAAAPDPRVLSVKRIDARLREYRLGTPELAAPTIVRVLLPNGYRPTRRYPVLYLLNGCCDYDVDGAQAWTTHGGVEKATARLPLIVVMPAGGRGGFYSDWYNRGRGGPPRYETYHVHRLIPWVDRTFATVAGRRGRAIAGLSMGGFGALSYAARHPDLFVAAAAFSGAVDSNRSSGAADDGLTGLDGGSPGDLWGPRLTQEVRWRAHNPWDLAENLRGLKLTLRTGNGLPGGPYGGGPDPIEVGVHDQMTSLHARLGALGLPHVWQDYGAGAHQWPYWARDLRLTLPQITAAFAHPPAPPARVFHRAVEPSFSVYGWRVRLRRPALEFASLAGANAAGFRLAGSGRATVVTPAFYVPSRRFMVRIGRVTKSLRAGPRGHLRVPLTLGPGNPAQEYSPGAQTKVYRVQVRVAAGG